MSQRKLLALATLTAAGALFTWKAIGEYTSEKVWNLPSVPSATLPEPTLGEEEPEPVNWLDMWSQDWRVAHNLSEEVLPDICKEQGCSLVLFRGPGNRVSIYHNNVREGFFDVNIPTRTNPDWSPVVRHWLTQRHAAEEYAREYAHNSKGDLNGN